MSDRRSTPFSGRVAHVSLRGKVEAAAFTEGDLHRVSAPVADLLSNPRGTRERQLLRGEDVTVIDTADGHAYGIALRDGYCGWIAAEAFASGPAEAPTHRVSAARTYGKTTPGLKVMGRVTPLSFGTRLAVLEVRDGWARAAWSRGTIHSDLHVPAGHLAPLEEAEPDPVAVAERFLGAPYLWGGNSAFGIDCSGLVQAALLSCGIQCPGDSDQQQAALPAIDGAKLRRGDLVFWKGHVAIMIDAERMIHANAHHMAVTHEDLAAAAARIETAGDDPVTGYARPQRAA